jgi:3-deoxy-D-manno-octulosonic-acid transferase
MFSVVYDLVLFFIGILALPALFWQWLRHGKYRESLKERLGIRFPFLQNQQRSPVIWMHMVSVGETRAALPFFKKLRETFPRARIVISSTTETGHKEAKRSLSKADAHFFLPLDFSWMMRKLVHLIRPDLLILVESEFWYHLLKYAKKNGANIALINGKISETSFRRFMWMRSFARKVLSNFDCLCLQSEPHYERFLQLGVNPEKMFVIGNLKLDAASAKLNEVEKQTWKKNLGIKDSDRVVVVGSTHESEEQWILSALDNTWREIPHLKVILVPRHPERFGVVRAQLKARGISWTAYSKLDRKTGKERVVLIDAMGHLNTCYQLAEIAIVGGSFLDGVGGHNIFEPVEVGVPVLFGPYMDAQVDLVDFILQSNAGLQIALTALASSLGELLRNKEKWEHMHEACLQSTKTARGATQGCWDAIQPLMDRIRQN